MMADHVRAGAAGGPRLSKSTLDQIGGELRSTYRRSGPKPAYLGDDPLPPEIADKLDRIEAIPMVHQKGIEAVAQALNVSTSDDRE